MAMFKPSQLHSGGVTVKPYTGNIAQELQFLTENTRKKKPTPFLDWVAQGNPAKKNKPILRLDCHRQPSKKLLRAIQFSSARTGTLATQAMANHELSPCLPHVNASCGKKMSKQIQIHSLTGIINNRGFSFERNCVLRLWESETLK